MLGRCTSRLFIVSRHPELYVDVLTISLQAYGIPRT